MRGFQVGVDIGGTFTDLILVDSATGDFTVAKSLTTPDDPARAVATALEDALTRARVKAAQVAQVIHGTTLVTNAIIERKGARAALMTTAGFRHVLEIGKEARFELYDIELELPEPLVPRYLRFDVPQRTLADGSTLAPAVHLRQLPVRGRGRARHQGRPPDDRGDRSRRAWWAAVGRSGR